MYARPFVCGRCHFGAVFRSITPPAFSIGSGVAALAWRDTADIRLPTMNEAIRPAPALPLQPADIPIVSVVVPTFNERDNVTTLYKRLEAAFAGVPGKVVFVDDNSPDGTWQVVRELSRHDSRVRCIRRIGRRGLSGPRLRGALSPQ